MLGMRPDSHRAQKIGIGSQRENPVRFKRVLVGPANPANSMACIIRVSLAYRPLPCVSSAYRFRLLQLLLSTNTLPPENPGRVCVILFPISACFVPWLEDWIMVELDPRPLDFLAYPASEGKQDRDLIATDVLAYGSK